MRLRRIAGQPSWQFGNDSVEAAVTRAGGHLAPVTFRLGRRRVQPFAIAPWAEERIAGLEPAVLRPLRGDFFCCPFGGNATPWRGERHPVHGEAAGQPWALESLSEEGGRLTLHARLQTQVRPGRIDKLITLVRGQTAVYSRHVLSGFSGPMNLGHHAMLAFTPASGPGLISTSPLRFGQVYPGEFERAALGGYTSLRPGAVFRSLERVPLATGGHTSLAAYPAREGYEDLVLVGSRPAALAWTAVAYPEQNYVWFALKDPRVLPATVLWHSNGGRHYPPWSGRHRGVLGLEEIIGHFHDGLAESARPNLLNRRGLPTCHRLSPRRPFVVNYVMAMAAVPARFGRVATIDPVAGGVRLTGEAGRSVDVALDTGFVTGA